MMVDLSCWSHISMSNGIQKKIDAILVELVVDHLFGVGYSAAPLISVLLNLSPTNVINISKLDIG